MPYNWVKRDYKPFICKNCDEPFKPRMCNQVYCCDNCRLEDRRDIILHDRALSLRIYRFLQQDPDRLESLITEMDSQVDQTKSNQGQDQEEEARALI